MSAFGKPLILLLILLFADGVVAHAKKGIFDDAYGHVGASLHTYTGSLNSSLSGGNSGYGVQLTLGAGDDWLAVMSKLKFEYSVGLAYFEDTTSSQMSYQLTSTTMGLGIRLNPIPVKHRDNFHIYLGGTMDFGFVSLQLPPSSSYTKLHSSEAAMEYGYSALLGVEAGFGKKGKSLNRLYVEGQFRNNHAKLAGKTAFALSGFTLSVGLAW